MNLSAEQKESFNQKSFLIVKNLINPQDFIPIENAYTSLIDKQAHLLYQQGLIDNLYTDEPFTTRLGKIANQWSKHNVEDLRKFLLSLDICNSRLESVFNFFFNKSLLSTVECLIGSEITLNPDQHVRAYIPSGNEKQLLQVPWHQDICGHDKNVDPKLLVAWIPFIDVNPKNGCLQIIPGIQNELPHDHDPIKKHYIFIKPEYFSDKVPVDCVMNRGDVLFMNLYAPHRGHPNQSSMVRWSMDLRFQKTGTPTGIEKLPSFIIHSNINPNSIVDSFDNWAEKWKNAMSKGE